MAMNNNFQRLAEEFVDANYEEDDEEGIDDEELEERIRGYLSNRGIDGAWMDEAVQVVMDYWKDWS